MLLDASKNEKKTNYRFDEGTVGSVFNLAYTLRKQ